MGKPNALEFSVRPARSDDLPSLVRLSQLWEQEGCTLGYPGFTEGDERVKVWLDGGYLFVAQIQDAVIAYAAGVVKLGKGSIFRGEGERYLHVHEVYVLLEHRQQGVGHRLMKAMLSKAESEGVERSMVGSNNVDWMRTFRFYEQHGYTMFSIQMCR